MLNTISTIIICIIVCVILKKVYNFVSEQVVKIIKQNHFNILSRHVEPEIAATMIHYWNIPIKSKISSMKNSLEKKINIRDFELECGDYVKYWSESKKEWVYGVFGGAEFQSECDMKLNIKTYYIKVINGDRQESYSLWEREFLNQLEVVLKADPKKMDIKKYSQYHQE